MEQIISCRKAIQELFATEPGVLHKKDVVEWMNKRYPGRWKETTIGDHLVGLSVNQPGAKHHPGLQRHAFLYWLGKMQYRNWNPDVDGDSFPTDQNTTKDLRLPSAARPVEVQQLQSPVPVPIDIELEKSLLINLNQLESGLRIFNENNTYGNQIPVGTTGNIDILCIDKSNNLVVIEIQAGGLDDRECGQFIRYMGWVKENLAGSRNVRGIIVASEFDDQIRYTAKFMPNVTLKQYVMKFEFSNI